MYRILYKNRVLNQYPWIFLRGFEPMGVILPLNETARFHPMDDRAFGKGNAAQVGSGKKGLGPCGHSCKKGGAA